MRPSDLVEPSPESGHRPALRTIGDRVALGLAMTALGVGVTHWGPALSAWTPARRRLLPALAGCSGGDHLALTFDDGPDHASTPFFLDLLAEYDVRATFFILGEHLAAHRRLVEEMAAQGHELAVHGWDHRCLAWKRPGGVREQLSRTSDTLANIIGQPPVRYRPPYGVLTTEGLLAARAAGLHTVLWSTWGRDWEKRATPDGIVRRVERRLRPGGTVLLHDTDRTSAPGSWRSTLTATRSLLDNWAVAGVSVGPLAEH